MKRFVAYALAGLMLGSLATTAFAADRVRQRDRKRDGSCSPSAVRSGDQVRKQDRKRDGSCAPSAIRQRDRLRDGSCR